jgi:putative membrane protein
MKLIGRFIFHIFSNAVAIVIAASFVPGFLFNGDLVGLAVAAFVLSVINTFIRPVLKLMLGPIVVLTFGLFLVVLNAISLFLVPYLLEILGFGSPITIEGYLPLLLATLIISAVNVVVGLSAKMGYK